MKQNLLNTLLLIIFYCFTISFIAAQNNGSIKKEIPAEFKNKVNPVKGDESLKLAGLRNYNRHCVSCHGKNGAGDGVMSKSLKVSPGDLTTAEFQKYTDGEIYYLSFIGINDRPDFMKLIPVEEEKWAVVNYLRTIQKK